MVDRLFVLYKKCKAKASLAFSFIRIFSKGHTLNEKGLETSAIFALMKNGSRS